MSGRRETANGGVGVMGNRLAGNSEKKVIGGKDKEKREPSELSTIN